VKGDKIFFVSVCHIDNGSKFLLFCAQFIFM
jgi:hypothetical protein